MAKKIGIIGCGIICDRHIAGLRDAGAEIVGAVVRSEVSQARIKNQFSIPVFDTPSQLLQECNPDGVVVASPNHAHAEHTIEAIEAGCHVLCEKPMAINGIEAKAMMQKSIDADRCLMVGLNLRFAEHTRIAANMCGSGKLGHIYHARCSWIRSRSIPGIGKWFTSKDLAGGGVMIDAGIHALDAAWFMMGKPDPVTVSAGTLSLFGGRTEKYKSKKSWAGHSAHSDKMDVEDFCTAFIRFQNGSTLQLDVSWAANTKETDFSCTLFGKEGGIAWEKGGFLEVYDAEGRGTVVYGRAPATAANVSTKTKIKGLIKRLTGRLQNPGEKAKEGGSSSSQFPSMYDHFLQCMDKNECIVSGRDGYILQTIIDAIYKSADESREIRIDNL